MTNEINITENSKELFIALAKDAANWSGMPLLNGNVKTNNELRGNLTQLKVEGLLNTFYEEGCRWVIFTEKGKAYAAELGIEI